MTGRISRDWSRYAIALDMYLSGHTLQHIADRFGVSRERARQMVAEAKAQLAFRVFKGLARPLPTANSRLRTWRRS